MKTHNGGGFAVDLSEDWNFYPGDAPGHFYFQHGRMDAGLSVTAFPIEAEPENLAAIAREMTSVSIDALAEAAIGAGLAFATTSQELFETPSGCEVEAAGKTEGGSHWRFYAIVRPCIFVSLQIESASLSESELTRLFDAAQMGLTIAGPPQS